ncbi:MAG TPA: hypothetical protein VKV19_04325 [Ktedonobacteraceae bacterium]|nr:hypothetical protein [Ktedonobacteraceae bacterium]
MATTRRSLSPETLKRRWQERCQQGNFSPAVLGVGTIRVFGRSGDAPVTFPRIESLAALETLEEDERWAVEVAQGIVTAAQNQNRPVMATQPPRAGAAPTPTVVEVFDPKLENMLILSLTRGG